MPSWDYFGGGIGLIVVLVFAWFIFKKIAPNAYSAIIEFIKNLISKD